MKGLNYGKLSAQKSKILRIVDYDTNNEVLAVDKRKIKNANINKGELSLQIENEEGQDMLCQIRLAFYQPGYVKAETSMKAQQVQTLAEKCLKSILKDSKIQSAAGEVVATLQEVNFVAPRGKYSVNFYARHLGLHGATFSHRVQYKEIKRGFILPLNNQAQVAIVLDLTRPITMGQTHHNYLVLQIRKDTIESKVEINKEALKQSDRVARVQQLSDSYSGEQFQIIVDLLHSIAAISLIQPSQSYKSIDGHSSVRASLKAQFGWLYMLKNSLIFIPRPVSYIKVSDVARVQFQRAGASNKNFDIKFIMKGQEKSIEIMGVDKRQMDGLADYFKEREVEVDMQKQSRLITEELGEETDSQAQDQDFKEQEIKQSSYQSSGQDEIGSEEESSTPAQQKRAKKKK